MAPSRAGQIPFELAGYLSAHTTHSFRRREKSGTPAPAPAAKDGTILILIGGFTSLTLALSSASPKMPRTLESLTDRNRATASRPSRNDKYVWNH